MRLVFLLFFLHYLTSYLNIIIIIHFIGYSVLPSITINYLGKCIYNIVPKTTILIQIYAHLSLVKYIGHTDTNYIYLN